MVDQLTLADINQRFDWNKFGIDRQGEEYAYIDLEDLAKAVVAEFKYNEKKEIVFEVSKKVEVFRKYLPSFADLLDNFQDQYLNDHSNEDDPLIEHAYGLEEFERSYNKFIGANSANWQLEDPVLKCRATVAEFKQFLTEHQTQGQGRYLMT